MACARPLLVCSGASSPIVRFLQPIGCAKLITEYDVDQKTDEMAKWLGSITRGQLIEMGNKGLDIIRKHYTKEIVTQQYVELIQSITK